MQSDHQEYHEIETSSDRSFGLTVGGILILIEAYRIWSSGTLDTIGIILLVIGAPLIIVGAVYPKALGPLNKLWLKFGFLLFKIVNPITMLMIYVLTVIPIGLILKLVGKDPLRLRLEKDSKSYWIERDPSGPPPESMKNQF